MLIGTDLWARFRLTLPPPPANTCKNGRTWPITIGLVPRTAAEEQELQEFLSSELDKFKNVRGPTTRIMHTIQTKTDIPIKQRYRPQNPAMQRIIDEVSSMETDGIIEPSNNAWSSPIVIVRKKDGRHRFCIDFRKVNEVTERLPTSTHRAHLG